MEMSGTYTLKKTADDTTPNGYVIKGSLKRGISANQRKVNPDL